MQSVLRKALVIGVTTLIIATGFTTAPAFAFGCRHHMMHHSAVSYDGWPDRYAQVSSGWRPLGYGCGPFGENADGWDIGWGGPCYYPWGF